MKNRILVAYATQYGTTTEVATRIASILRESGLEVDCRPMGEIRTVEEYRAFVLGAPFYFGRWPRAARRFLGRFGPTLAQRDVAVFATGQIDSLQTESESRTQLDTLVAHYDWLRPFQVAMLGGCWDPGRLRWKHRWLMWLPTSPLRTLPASDMRDWPAIEGWAHRVARALIAGVPAPVVPKPAAGRGSRANAPMRLIREYIADQQR